MTGGSSLAFPASRKLAGWWRQLAPYQPEALWVGHLLLHHVEALVRVTYHRRLDAFPLFLLRAVALDERDLGPAPGSSELALDRLDRQLHLGRQVLRQALRGLEAEGLAGPTPGGRWTLTPLGRQALERQEYPHASHERRTFHFLDNGGGRPGTLPPHFLNLHNSTGIPWPVAEGLGFDVRVLEACLGQPLEWKQRHGFPLEVEEVLGQPAPAAAAEDRGAGSVTQPPPWQRVVLDRPERILAALILVPAAGGGRQLVGLAVRQDGWVLQADGTLFTLGGDWQQLFPELAEEPPPDAWRQAWRTWCEPRGLPADEVDACVLQRQGTGLRVIAPGSLVERLRVTRSDALKGDTWLLAGESRIRTAALVEVVEARPGPAGG